MEFLNTMDTGVWLGVLSLVLLVVFCCAMAAFGVNLLGLGDSGVLATIVFLVITLGSGFGFYVSYSSYNEVDVQNRSNLEQNLIQKYEVDSLGTDIGTEESQLDPTQASEQLVTVVIDGDEYLFTLTQNEETYEPELQDPPRFGGPDGKAVSVEGLLK